MDLGIPLDLTFYRLLRDQGSILAGVLALFAGVGAYYAGRRQAKAVREQNRELRQNESRRLAREVLTAARLVDGMLNGVERSIETIPPFRGDQQQLGDETARNLRTRLAALAVDPMIAPLGRLGQKNIEAYFMLCFQIDRFRKAGDTTGAALHREFAVIQADISSLREAIAEEVRMAEQALASE
jgi:hypothetical protein